MTQVPAPEGEPATSGLEARAQSRTAGAMSSSPSQSWSWTRLSRSLPLSRSPLRAPRPPAPEAPALREPLEPRSPERDPALEPPAAPRPPAEPRPDVLPDAAPRPAAGPAEAREAGLPGVPALRAAAELLAEVAGRDRALALPLRPVEPMARAGALPAPVGAETGPGRTAPAL